jgi:hypothetical protein
MKQCEVEEGKERRIEQSGVSEIGSKNYAKSIKIKHKKEKTSPDRPKDKLRISKNQTI